MQYRKIQADRLFDGYRFRDEEVVVVSEKGIIADLLPVTEAGDGVERYEGILSPGFINCHCHLELSHMRGKIPEKTGLVDFVFKVVTERSASEEEISDAIATAEAAMKASGIVAVGDICNNTLTLAQKAKNNLYYYNFIEASGWLPAVSEARFERAVRLYEACLQSVNLPTANCSIVPHAPYSVSEKLWKEIQPFFRNKVASIHNQETRFEDEFFIRGTGDFVRMYRLMGIDNSHHQPTKRSSLPSYFDKLSGAENIILVHNTFTKQQDIDYVKNGKPWGAIVSSEKDTEQLQTPNLKPQTFFCLCPNANLYIENTLPDVGLFRRNNCTIVLGTDSLASNWSLSVLEEIKILRNQGVAGLEEMLQWATLNGARALGMDSQLGSFERGKKPGGVLVSEHDLRVTALLF